MLLKKKISLAVVEGDCALSANNCQADAIPAAVCGGEWVGWPGEPGGERSEACRRGVVSRAVEAMFSVRAFYLSCQKAHRLCSAHKPAFEFRLS